MASFGYLELGYPVTKLSLNLITIIGLGKDQGICGLTLKFMLSKRMNLNFLCKFNQYEDPNGHNR